MMGGVLSGKDGAVPVTLVPIDQSLPSNVWLFLSFPTKRISPLICLHVRRGIPQRPFAFTDAAPLESLRVHVEHLAGERLGPGMVWGGKLEPQ